MSLGVLDTEAEWRPRLWLTRPVFRRRRLQRFRADLRANPGAAYYFASKLTIMLVTHGAV